MRMPLTDNRQTNPRQRSTCAYLRHRTWHGRCAVAGAVRVPQPCVARRSAWADSCCIDAYVYDACTHTCSSTHSCPHMHGALGQGRSGRGAAAFPSILKGYPMRCTGEAAAAPRWNVRSTAAVLQRLSTGRQHRPVPAGPAPRADMVLVRVGARWSSAHRVKINTCARHACMRKCAQCACAACVRACVCTHAFFCARSCSTSSACACVHGTHARAWVLRPGGRWRKVWFLRERAQDPLDDWLCTVPAPLRSRWHTGPRLRPFIPRAP